MKAELFKEIKYVFRSGKLIVILACFVFFSLITPIMLKVILPLILSGQLGSKNPQDYNEIINISQIGSIRNYMGDVFEILTIVISFSLCGIIASEIKNNTLVFPLCSGKKLIDIIFGKLIIYGLMIFCISVTALIINYIYSGILFGFEISILPILYGGFLHGLYMVYLISCLLMYGVITRNSILSGFLTLATAYGVHIISSLLNFQIWTPSGLIIQAQKLTLVDSSNVYNSVIVTILLIFVFITFALYKLKNLEWNTRNEIS